MAAQSKLRSTAAEDALAAFLERWTGLLRGRIRNASRLSRLLATLGFLTSIILGAEGGRRWWRNRRHEREQGRKLVRTNSWLHNKDGSRTIYVPYKDSTSKVVINTTKPLTFEAHRRLFLNPPRVSGLGDGVVPTAQSKPGLNLAFLHQFLSLMSIMIPRWSSKEAGLLLSHGLFLMLRTYLSLVVARLDGEIVRDLVAGNGKAFSWGLAKVRKLPQDHITPPVMVANTLCAVVRLGRVCLIHERHDQIPRVQSVHSFPDKVDTLHS